MGFPSSSAEKYNWGGKLIQECMVIMTFYICNIKIPTVGDNSS